jgi:hypothetical protein
LPPSTFSWHRGTTTRTGQHCHTLDGRSSTAF